MENSNKIKYFKYGLKNNLYLKLKWLYYILTFIKDDIIEDEFIVKKNNEIYGRIDKDLILLDNNYKTSLFDYKDEIVITNDELPNVKDSVRSTIGRVISNTILLVYPFGSKIPFINQQFTISYIEDNFISPMLNRYREDNDSKDVITPDEYHRFLDAVNFIESLADVLSISATEKSLLPPPGIEEYKKKLINEYVKKYGKDALKDIRVLAEIETKLAKYDDEYLKDDPSYGKLLSGKVKNTARKRMNLLFGIGNVFNPNDIPKPVLRSLKDGYPKDPEQLLTLLNDARAGSYSRGSETQQGGVVTEATLRATSDIKIDMTDCKSKETIKVLLTNKNRSNFLNRYIMVNDKLILLTEENIEKFIGKEINLRTPLYCKSRNGLCRICVGKDLEEHPNGVSIIVSSLGGFILKESLSKFHGSSLELVKIDTDPK